MQLQEIVCHLDTFLEAERIRDSCKNGLEVGGKKEVEKVGFAVDACAESFRKAASSGCDLLVVHHGLFWGDVGYITDITYGRIKYLMDHEIALYAAHLPLDVHPIVGNNVQLADLLQLSVEGTFYPYKGTDVGVLCTGGMLFEDLLQRARSQFPVRYVQFTERAERIGIITGSGGQGIPYAVRAGCDTFVTGEVLYQDHRTIMEYEVSLIRGGHYATETLGLKALIEYLGREFTVDCEFLELTEIPWKTRK